MPPISISGYAHLLFFGLLIPIGAVRSQKLLANRPLPPRQRYFRAAVIQVALFALLSIVVARQNAIVLFPRRAPPPLAFATGAVFLAIAIPFGWTRWVKAVRERQKVVALFMPTNNNERMLWLAAAALAGFGEEITWRGVQTTLLNRLTGNVWVAIAIAIVMFSISHAIQGWNSVAVIALYTTGFHAIVWLSGSLYVAMVVHFLYDLIAGLSYGYLGRKYGYDVPEATTTATPLPATDSV